jgi:hypothetical protein
VHLFDFAEKSKKYKHTTTAAHLYACMPFPQAEAAAWQPAAAPAAAGPKTNPKKSSSSKSFKQPASGTPSLTSSPPSGAGSRKGKEGAGAELRLPDKAQAQQRSSSLKQKD